MNDGLQHRDMRDKAVIVLTRTYFGRLHKSDILRVLHEFVNGVHFGSDFWFKTMLTVVRDSVRRVSHREAA